MSTELPEEVSLFDTMDSLVIANGQLTGGLPSSIFKMQNLKQLDLDKNAMDGELIIDGEGSIERLDINFNNFSGSIDFLASFPNLVEAQLDNNMFDGTIPDNLGSLTNLRILTLHGNALTGTMPQSVCDLKDHKLKYLMADCDGSNPKVVCPCCTHCNPYR